MNKEKLKQRISSLKTKTLALSALLSAPLNANASQNSQPTDNSFETKTEVVTKYLNQKYSQTSTFQSSEKSYSENGKFVKNYSAATQYLCELGDGYFMTSSQLTKQKTENNLNAFCEKDEKLYLTTPEGKSYDCSFLHQNKKSDFLPVGFEKDCFVKENGMPDTALENKLINEVKKIVGVDKITPEATIQYNNIIKDKKLEEARKKGMPEDVVAKIDIYLQQNLEFLNTGKTYIASISSFSNGNAQKTQILPNIKAFER